MLENKDPPPSDTLATSPADTPSDKLVPEVAENGVAAEDDATLTDGVDVDPRDVVVCAELSTNRFDCDDDACELLVKATLVLDEMMTVLLPSPIDPLLVETGAITEVDNDRLADDRVDAPDAYAEGAIEEEESRLDVESVRRLNDSAVLREDIDDSIEYVSPFELESGGVDCRLNRAMVELGSDVNDALVERLGEDIIDEIDGTEFTSMDVEDKAVAVMSADTDCEAPSLLNGGKQLVAVGITDCIDVWLLAELDSTPEAVVRTGLFAEFDVTAWLVDKKYDAGASTMNVPGSVPRGTIVDTVVGAVIGLVPV